MFEAIEYYQNLAEKFDSRILIVPGIIVVLIGLCIWLSGLRWKKILGALAGGGFFAAVVMSIGNYGTPIVLAAAFFGIVIGALVEKIMLGVSGTAMTAVMVLVIVSAITKQKRNNDMGYLNDNTKEYHLSQQNCPRWPEYEAADTVISPPQAMEITSKISSFIVSGIIDNIKSYSVLAFAAAGFTVLVAGFAALVMPRIFIATVSSLLGSAVIFAGMIMLLFYKGSKPVNYISEKSSFYAMVIAAMLIFGAMVQLVLSPPAAKQAEQSVPDKKRDGVKK